MANVGLATPHGGFVTPEFYRGMLTMQLAWTQHQFTHVEVDTMIVGKARNMLVEVAKANGIEVMWFVDNDVMLPPHAGLLIDQCLQLGVVSGLYFNRRPPFLPQVYEIAKEPEFAGMYWPKINYPESGLSQEDAVGAGCLLVRMDVFDRLTDAWLERANRAYGLLEVDPSLALMVKQMSPWFEFLNRKGEDLYFCERCRDIDQTVWVNYDVKCAHLTLLGVEEQHFKQIKDGGLLVKAPLNSGYEPVAAEMPGPNIGSDHEPQPAATV